MSAAIAPSRSDTHVNTNAAPNAIGLDSIPSSLDSLSPPLNSLGSDHTPEHWQVRINHGNRSVLLILLGLAFSAQAWDIDAPMPWWTLMLLACYGWPHLLYWRARRSAHPMQIERWGFLIETFLAGAFTAALGFPVWLSAVLFICNGLNFVVFHGVRAGLPRLIIASGLGAAMVWASGLNMPWHPDTHWLTTLVCILALSIYTMLFAMFSRRGAQALRRKNHTLREQYEQIQTLQARLQEQAVRDPLTGLYNRRHLSDVLGPELARCRAARKPLALLLIDIDHFKRVNDTRGHAAGDVVLQTLARLMLRHVRAQDMAFRHGGEEFLVMLPEASLETALQRAEALRTAFGQTPVRLDGQGKSAGPPLTVTLSCGVAAFPQHADEGEGLIDRADQALYAAKEQGRNRTLSYS